MSKYHHNYNKPEVPATPVVEESAPSLEEGIVIGGLEVLVDETPEVSAEATPEIPSNENHEEEIDNVKPVEVFDEIPVPANKIFRVRGCKRLNVRLYPSLDSEIVTTLTEFEPVVIDQTNDSEDFYKVSVNVKGQKFEGYCLKSFIK